MAGLSPRGLTTRLEALVASQTIYRHEGTERKTSKEGIKGQVVYGLPKPEAEALYRDMITMKDEWVSEVQVFRKVHHKELKDQVITYANMWVLLSFKALERMVRHPEREEAYMLVYVRTLEEMISQFAKVLRKDERSDEAIAILKTLRKEMLEETEKGN